MYIRCGECGKVSEAKEVASFARYECKNCGKTNEILNVTVKEWLGFNYRKYLQAIIDVINKDTFENLAAETPEDIKLGYLSSKQIDSLKEVFKDGFEKGSTISEIRENIRNEVKVKDLILDKETGRFIPKEFREISITRTETTRLANEGSREHYKDGGVQQYRWVATLSERICLICEDLNGQIFDINAEEAPPAHSLCRCTIIPITELDRF